MRIAFLHDWLTGMRGGERCLEVFCNLYPDSEVFSLIHQPDSVVKTISERVVGLSFLQAFPGCARYYRYLLPFFPLATWHLSRKLARRHREAPFDLVISVSHCAVKNVRSPEGLKHICYCLTPVRYLWDLYDVYFARSKLEPLIRICTKGLRIWDRLGAGRVTRFIAISSFVQERIKRIYGRNSDILFPPVDASWLQASPSQDKPEGFLCVSALVPYKNVDLIIKAFNQLQLPLTIVGKGPEEGYLRSIAGPNIVFCSGLSDNQLAELYRRSIALVFAAVEDFGMVAVEMQASGRPVVAYAEGGSLETVFAGEPPGNENATGVFFSELTSEALITAVKYTIDHQSKFTVDNCRTHALGFSVQSFKEKIAAVIKAELG